jgi:hypothetical protein
VFWSNATDPPFDDWETLRDQGFDRSVFATVSGEWGDQP